MSTRWDKQLDAMDASVFSSDMMFDADRYPQFKAHVERWSRAIAEHEGAAALAREQEAQPAPDVREILENYRCTHFCDEDGGLPLSDALAAAFGDKDVGRALEEIELIADALHGAAQPAAQEEEEEEEDYSTVVPLYPTRAMQDAWDSAPFDTDTDVEFRRAYKAMIEAAPQWRQHPAAQPMCPACDLPDGGLPCCEDCPQHDKRAAQPAAQEPSDEQIVDLACRTLTRWEQDPIKFARAVLALRAQPAAQEPGETWICACNMTWMADITYCRGCGREKE